MIHQYKNNGYNIVLDVNSGSVHVVDDMVYDIIGLYENNTLEQITEELKDKYSVQDIKEAYEEIGELKEAGQLFTEDIYEPYIDNFKDRPTVVKALCLHIAHDCNLACKYCFAEEGEYHGRRALMSYEVGKKALDFLVANSGSRKNLEVDFFGGEPTMNFGVVKEVVEYGRSLEEKHNKHFRFTLTTNGVLLNDEIMEFANKEMDNVVLSIDGRKEVLISPCDGKVTVCPIRRDGLFLIKQTQYTVRSLLKDEKLAKRYEGGTAYIIRLTVDDYHRYCYVADGVKSAQRKIRGVFHTVNPVANDYAPIYKMNTREYCLVQTEELGTVLQMEVGALMVGRIKNHKKKVSVVHRGEEKGMFEFGGSTVVLLTEPGKVQTDEDLVRNSATGAETLVKMGEKIGEKCQKEPFLGEN